MPASEFLLSRVFDAPRSLVFEAWSKPEHLVHWWGRKLFTALECEVDFRRGGVWRICMRPPAGKDFWVTGTYLEITVPERIVFVCKLENEVRNHEAVFTVVLIEQEGKTLLTLHSKLMDLAKARDGAESGWSEAMDSLDAYLAGCQG